MGCSNSKKGKANGREGSTKNLSNNLMWDRNDKKFEDVYKIKRVIGEGSLGSVAQVIKKSTGECYAMKTIMFTRISAWMVKELINEVNILRAIDHPNIVRPIEVFHEKRRIYLVMELCEGGDLYEHALYTESQSVVIMKKITSAIALCHQNNVIHRDIKFENIMFEKADPHAEVKLIDFGLSKVYHAGEHMKKAVGTVYSMAPEVLDGDYTESADMWSLGVIAFMLLSGDLPFDGYDQASIADKVRVGKYKMRGAKWKKVSDAAKDFIAKLLVLDPSKRLTASQALQSPWLSSKKAADKALDSASTTQIVNEIKNYGSYGKLRKTAMMVCAHQSSATGIQQLRDAFNAVDTANNGTISLEEFQALVKQHIGCSDEIQQMFNDLDVDKTGRIHYREFVAATLEANGQLSQEKLAEAFDRLDSDNSGFITKANLKELLGEDYDEAEADEMIASADIKGNGKIDFEEFLAMMTKRRRETVTAQDQ